MGLDMYLYATRYCSGGYDHSSPEEKKLFASVLRDMGIEPTISEKSLEVKVTVGYWRKANAIHAWFVRECQEGVDECQNTGISREQLTQLKTLCQEVITKSKVAEGDCYDGTKWTKEGGVETMTRKGKVIQNPKVAHKLLPCQSGFFFGGTDYDECYLQDLEHTIKVVDNCLSLPDCWDLSYQSSW
jgi:hypothetical protein